MGELQFSDNQPAMRSFAIDHTPAAAYTPIAVDFDNPFEVMYGIAIALNAVSAQILNLFQYYISSSKIKVRMTQKL